MKKFLCLLALVMMTAPVLADIEFYGTDAGSGQITIGYKAVDPNKAAPSAISLTIDFDRDSDTAQLKGDDASAAIVSKDTAEFVFYPDYAYDVASSDPNTIINNYDPNDASYASAHPLTQVADKGAPVLTGGVDTVGYCVAHLSNPPAKGPEDNGSGGYFDLVTLQLEANGAASTWVTIDENSLRGGVVGSKLSTNLPIEVEVAFGCACPGDWDSSNTVNFTDVLAILGQVNTYGTGKNKTIDSGMAQWDDCGDWDSSNTINFTDVLAILGQVNTFGTGKNKTLDCP